MRDNIKCPQMTPPDIIIRLEGETTPVIQFRLLGLATLFLAGFLVVTADARFTQGAFTVQLLLQPAQCLIYGLSFF